MSLDENNFVLLQTYYCNIILILLKYDTMTVLDTQTVTLIFHVDFYKFRDRMI